MKYYYLPLSLLLFACSEEIGKPQASGGNPSADPGKTLEITVPAEGRVFVSLKEPAIVPPPVDATSTAWDLAFEKYDVFTNSGESCPGKGGDFGPLDASTYDEGVAPAIPFLTEDESGGAFRDFWAYDGNEHVLWVRYHVFGVREGGKTWKVQILGFYGEQAGAPVSAIYRLRWAEVTAAGSGPTQTLADIDGTAGGAEAPPDVPSECLDLGTGARVKHTPAEAAVTKDWHLCFRRATIRVNGELGGPRGAEAVDLHAAETKDETLALVKMRTDDTELPRFEKVDQAALADTKLVWRGDRIISAFTDFWVDPASDPPAPVKLSWLVQSAADGFTRYLMIPDRFEGASPEAPGKIIVRVKVEGAPAQ